MHSKKWITMVSLILAIIIFLIINIIWNNLRAKSVANVETKENILVEASKENVEKSNEEQVKNTEENKRGKRKLENRNSINIASSANFRRNR